MDIGLCIGSKIDDIDYVVRAEQLGYSHAWFADSQMIWSDVYACLAVAATRTTRMQLGTGVSIVGTRTAPVTAAAIATINRMAPGRTFLGVGNGHTAWRLMGQKPMPMADFEEYVRVVRGLLDGLETDYTVRGRTARIKFDMAHLGYLDLEHHIPIYVSSFGPRGQAMAGKYGDGVVTAMAADPDAVRSVWSNVLTGAEQVGRSVDRNEFLFCALTAACVLRAGEDLTSDRVVDTVGSMVIGGYHYTYDYIRNFGGEPPDFLADDWEEFSALVEAVPEAQRHRRIHVGHCTWLEPEERKFVTPDRIAATCLVGSGPEIVEQLHALESVGLGQVMLLPSLDKQYEALEDVSREVLAKM
jgi:alkanesulfonate monooxygenase SsuD/methylene tetrahydromethanopterin reductase-like flavin-dependent oxidoreductase (luciferase family)